MNDYYTVVFKVAPHCRVCQAHAEKAAHLRRAALEESMRRLLGILLLMTPILASSQSKVGALASTGTGAPDAGPGARPRIGQTVNNPLYSHWAQFKPGTSVTVKEVTTLPDGTVGTAVITSKLLSKTKETIRVETLVSAGGVGSWASATDTTRTVSEYPAKVSFEEAQTPDAAGYSVTEGKELVEYKGKQVETEWIESSVTHGDETTVERLWTVQTIPGGILKRTVEKKRGDQVVHATTHLVEYTVK
jgi:hypothetical protein